MNHNDVAHVLRKQRLEARTHPALSESQRMAAAAAIDSVAHEFCGVLASLNPRFRRDLFLRACGVES